MFDDWRAEIDKADDQRQRTRLNRRTILAAVEARREGGAFHTLDITSDRRVIEAHASMTHDPRFKDWLERFLREEAPFIGLRGPLPGHRSRGHRWVFRSVVAR